MPLLLQQSAFPQTQHEEPTWWTWSRGHVPLSQTCAAQEKKTMFVCFSLHSKLLGVFAVSGYGQWSMKTHRDRERDRPTEGDRDRERERDMREPCRWSRTSLQWFWGFVLQRRHTWFSTYEWGRKYKRELYSWKSFPPLPIHPWLTWKLKADQILGGNSRRTWIVDSL